ncbi:DNA mismatch repair endonuclease MutL [Candidatus Roizmanbacteria bacterium]|nr:MAG: DNA mismatch repair endonuclease MutL [Candidatus Roizmanbacteria bacterium]
MGIIHHLPDHLINQIAAGEVIERPVYILKELLDNAIDASAKSIIIRLSGFGMEAIEVIDDGIGMTREDIELSYLRHTTSKIYDEDDLQNIQSFGFRGEALASIASVCRLSIASRTPDDIAGYRVIIENGKKTDARIVPMPQGTDISVSHIFTKTPARKKFLRSEQTEYRHIISMISSYALSFPAIRFQIFHNNKLTATYPAVSDFEARLELLLPGSVLKELIPVSEVQEYLSLSGYISKPQLTYKTTKQYFLYLNGRPITDTTIAGAIKDAYGTLLSPTDYPQVIIHLEIPHHLVDVNVHPRKEEVKFMQPKAVYQAVYDGIVKSLKSQNLRFYDKRWQNTENAPELQIRDGGTQTYAAHRLKEQVLGSPKDFDTKDLMQIHDTYILLQAKGGLLLIDQHAAHERVLYERFLKAYEEGLSQKDIYTYKQPISLDLSLSEQETVKEYQERIIKFGIMLQANNNKWELCSVPDLMKDRDPLSLLREMLEILQESESMQTVDSYAHKMITYLACRSAIKAGDPLTKVRMKELIDSLKNVENPYTCPHGRPLQVSVDLKTIDKMFKR